MNDASPLAQPLTLPCGAVLPNRLGKSAMTEGLSDASARGALFRHLRDEIRLAIARRRWPRRVVSSRQDEWSGRVTSGQQAGQSSKYWKKASSACRSPFKNLTPP